MKTNTRPARLAAFLCLALAFAAPVMAKGSSHHAKTHHMHRAKQAKTLADQVKN